MSWDQFKVLATKVPAMLLASLTVFSLCRVVHISRDEVLKKVELFLADLGKPETLVCTGVVVICGETRGSTSVLGATHTAQKWQEREKGARADEAAGLQNTS